MLKSRLYQYPLPASGERVRERGGCYAAFLLFATCVEMASISAGDRQS